MGSLLILSLATVLVGVICFLIWSYRKNIALKAEASQERYAQLFSDSLSTAPREEGAAVAASPQPRPADIPRYTGKERLLGKADTLMLYVLRAGLPGHEILARVNLAEVVDPSPALQEYERDLLRRRLSQHSLDFVVCDKSTKIVAVVEFEAGTDAAVFKAACLEAARIRHVQIKADTIPRRENIHSLVFGNHSRPDA